MNILQASLGLAINNFPHSLKKGKISPLVDALDFRLP